MKLAIIDYLDEPKNITWETVNRLEAALTEKGVAVCRARDLPSFQHEHGNLREFDGFLYHPGVLEQYKFERVPKIYPSLRFAIGSHDPESRLHYFGDENIAIVGFADPEGVYNYFFGDGKTQKRQP